MKLSAEDEATILRTIRANPDSCVVLPPEAYLPDGVVRVYRDNLLWTMPRYLWVKLGRELVRGKQLRQKCSTVGCITPNHRELSSPIRAPHPECPNGHAYPKKPERWPDGTRRCRLCREDRNARKARSRGGYSKARVECSHGHKITGKNVYRWKDSKGRTHRKCRQCCLDRQRRYRENRNSVTERTAA